MNPVETLLRPDTALQWAFGRHQCAHSSVIQDTLDACTEDTVIQLQHANGQVYRTHGRAAHHDFAHELLLLDVDLTGLLASPHAEGSTKRYVPDHRGAGGDSDVASSPCPIRRLWDKPSCQGIRCRTRPSSR